jgi:predicted component of viral defense system (DUF524 family)
MRTLGAYDLAFRTPSGEQIACVRLIPSKEVESETTAPLAQVDDAEAREYGETLVQLRESERYEYQVIPEKEGDFRLRCSLASRRRSLGSEGHPDAGLIETRSFCGTLLLELVEGVIENEKPAIATALIDVRSVKLNYRSEYRGMLRRLAEEIAGLVADARSSAKAGFKSSFEERRDEGWLQLQLELLREILDSSEFTAAIQRILSYPHETLTTVIDSVQAERSIRWSPSAVRQLITSNPRQAIPAKHPLRMSVGIDSIAERVSIPHKSRYLDTPENRFIKFTLGEFRSFLAHAQSVFENTKGWDASVALTRRLASTIDDWLGRSFFREISHMRLAPLGSPALQRKAGYREILRWWLQFRTASELSWEGGEDLFRAGQRDVASLYEYWLFFELLDWFYRNCRSGTRPSVEELIEGLEDGSPNLRLKKRLELGPFVGAISHGGRTLNARFSYNKRFGGVQERAMRGSWTRSLHPDYTMSFWPEGVDETEAEREELLVHIHFDAKYRVENIEGIFGVDSSEDVDEELDGNYKRQDLLKMHAYKDAIKRSQGAYILYPASSSKPVRFSGFHEILPGLGAFGVSPDASGKAQGIEELTLFLNEAISHLCDRTSARERNSYHLAQSYNHTSSYLKASSTILPERDVMDRGKIAIPPAEHLVLIAMRYHSTQLSWMHTNSMAVFSIGKVGEDWRVQSEWSGLRHLIMRENGSQIAQGLWRIAKPGYRIMNGLDLAALGYPMHSTRDVYAVFDVEPTLDMPTATWSVKNLFSAVRACERDKEMTLARISTRRSLVPRVATLASLVSILMT